MDLNFGSLTNRRPIRRLNPNFPKKAEAQAAWLKFSGFELELLEQSFYRTGAPTDRYESSGGRFVADLEVNQTGFVIRYPNVWQIEV